MDVFVFGNFIKERRKEKGMTQKALAEKVSVTDKAISRWENGHGFPDIESLEPLADALEVSLWELMHSQLDEREFIDRADVDEILNEAIQMSVQDILRAKRKRFIMSTIIIFLVFVLFVLTFVQFPAVG